MRLQSPTFLLPFLCPFRTLRGLKREGRSHWVLCRDEKPTSVWNPRQTSGLPSSQQVENVSIPTRIWPLTLTIPGHLLVPSELPQPLEKPHWVTDSGTSPHYPPASGPLVGLCLALPEPPVYLRWTPSGRALPCLVWACRKTDVSVPNRFMQYRDGEFLGSPVRTLSCQCRRPGFILWLGN